MPAALRRHGARPAPSTASTPSLPRSARSRALGAAVASALLTALLAGVLPVAGGSGAAEAATPSTKSVLFGVAGDIASARARTGERLAAHRYGFFEQRRVPKGRMLTVRFRSGQRWSETARLRAGSPGHAQVARWADVLKNRARKTFVAFHHEPEASGNARFGSADDYRAAYRRVVDIFRERGAGRKVIFTWQMTGWAFRADRSAANAAHRWYPGNRYVDVVGADPYNWHTCGHGRDRWKSLGSLVDPVIAFARPRGKQVALPEFASNRHARRAAWVRDAGRYLAANDAVIAAAFYFNREPTNRANGDCSWTLRSEGEYAALAAVAAKGKLTP